MIEDRNSKEYWDWRVKSHKNDEQKMIWYGEDWKNKALDLIVEQILTMFEGCTALDLGCGFGRFAQFFDPTLYLGVDFSPEMIKLAKQKYSNYTFEVGDIREYTPKRQYDVIFEVMSGIDFALDHKGFIDTFSPYATVAVICIHPTDTLIHFKNLS
jgi:trans-aconitate methyltransferase